MLSLTLKVERTGSQNALTWNGTHVAPGEAQAQIDALAPGGTVRARCEYRGGALTVVSIAEDVAEVGLDEDGEDDAEFANEKTPVR